VKRPSCGRRDNEMASPCTMERSGENAAIWGKKIHLRSLPVSVDEKVCCVKNDVLSVSRRRAGCRLYTTGYTAVVYSQGVCIYIYINRLVFLPGSTPFWS